MASFCGSSLLLVCWYLVVRMVNRRGGGGGGGVAGGVTLQAKCVSAVGVHIHFRFSVGFA